MTRTVNICRSSTVRMICGLLLSVAAVHIACVSRARAATPVSKEYQLKAAFLLNFAQFIQWPADVFPTPETPIIVGVLGDDPFGALLDQAFKDESIEGRKLVVKRSRKIEDLTTCQMLFISKSENERLTDIVATLKDTSIVTVGEMDQFVQRGGIINFYLEGGKVRFEINADEAQRRGLKINSQLLKRAKITSTAPGKDKK